jgi:hypothetical protein
MSPETPRPPTLVGQRAGNSKGLGGIFDPQNTGQTGELQDSAVLIAQTRIVLGCHYSLGTYREGAR